MDISSEDRKKLKAEIKEELKKEISSMVEREVRKQLKDKATGRHIKEVTANVLEDLFRAMFNRSSMWKPSVVK